MNTVYFFIGLVLFLLFSTTALFLFLARDAMEEDHFNDSY
ncbi:hypothetical protein UJ101_02016 [Flavobacteriaceae bacterium UJ101]|nr:hypothetical protein UJ101_02016 [Flavobacteriaceae bacterium UJ101]